MEDTRIAEDGRIILKLILRKQSDGVHSGFILFRTGKLAGFCENDNELLVYIKRERFDC